jgi:fused signal recognition particle receptor
MIYILLIAAVLVFGFGALLVGRARSRPRVDLEPPFPPAPTAVGGAPAPTDHRQPRATEPAVGGAAGIVAPGEVSPELQQEIDAAMAPAVTDEDLPEETEFGATEVAERPRLRDRLSKARANFAASIGGVRAKGKVGDEAFEDVEEALLRADVGLRVTSELLDGLRVRVKAKEITTADQLVDALKAEMKSRLAADRSLQFVPDEAGTPNVWLFVGVNGVGKTTTIGKVGAQQAADGRKVVMAAGDTFRAAAAEQLTTWADRSGAHLVRGNEGGDPSAVIFDAVESATARKADLVLADTAGRLHNKTNLMEELRKVRRVAEKGSGRVTEVLLVIDATTGQNGMNQAREFADATAVTGVVLTKLDGSAKGGIVFPIQTELGIPVKLVGVGEGIGDLIPFDPDEFVDALFE